MRRYIEQIDNKKIANESENNLLLCLGLRKFRFSNLETLIVDTENLSYKTLAERYLGVFKHVKLIVRAKVKCLGDDHLYYKVCGENIDSYHLPYYEGPYQYFVSYKQISKSIEDVLKEHLKSSIIIRVPCPIGFVVIKKIKDNRPYALEVVGDPWDVFSPGAARHILRPFFRLLFTYELKKACKNAIAALYVTEKALQQRYPCKGYMFGASDVELHEGDFAVTSRIHSIKKDKDYLLLYAGTLNQLYKAPDILIRAIKICKDQGYKLRLHIAGDGKYRKNLEKLTKKLAVEEAVTFLGMLSREELFDWMDKADLFVLPSRVEGLPRAMIEAMARGLPCIGSNVGGIPELLPPEDLVPPGNAKALAKKIMEVLNDPGRMDRMSERNLSKAMEYKSDILQKKREDFYLYVKEKTREWLEG